MTVEVVYDNGRRGLEFLDSLNLGSMMTERVSDDEIKCDLDRETLDKLVEEFWNGDVILELRLSK